MRCRWGLGLLGLAALLLQRPARAGDEVTVRIEGDKGVVLQRAAYEDVDFQPQDPSLWTATWVSICSVPCEVSVPRGRYRIGGDGVRPSETFAIDGARGDHVVLHARKASVAAHTAGLVLVGVGSTLFVGGGVALFFGMVAESFAQMFCWQKPCGSSTGSALMAAGAGGLTLGGMLTVAGIATAVGNGSSTVSSEPNPSQNPPRSAFVLPLLGVTF